MNDDEKGKRKHVKSLMILLIGITGGYVVGSIFIGGGLFSKLIFLILGLIGGAIIQRMMLSKNKGLAIIANAMRTKTPLIFLETPTTVYLRKIVKSYQNLGITDQKEIVIMTTTSMKQCTELGIPIAHGDLYRSITVPQDLRLFIKKLQEGGWSDNQVGDFLYDIGRMKEEDLMRKYEALATPQFKMNQYSQLMKESLKIKENSKDKKEIEKCEAIILECQTKIKEIDKNKEVDMHKYDIYMGLPSTIKDFIWTGINRVSIHGMLETLVEKRELEHMGQRDLFKLAMAAFIILIGLGLGFKFFSGGLPAVTDLVSVITPPKIAP